MLHRITPGRRWRNRLIGFGLTLIVGLTAVVVSPTPAHASDHSPLPVAVTLNASFYTVPMGHSDLLTAVSNYDMDVWSGGLWLQIYDRTTGQRIGACNTGTMCQADAYNPVGYSWTRDFVAIVGAPSTTIPTNPTWIVSQSGPIFVTWSNSGYNLSLQKSPGLVSAWANKPVNGYGVIEIRNAYTNALLVSCSTGFVCYAPVSFGAYVAYVVPWGIAASSNTLYY